MMDNLQSLIDRFTYVELGVKWHIPKYYTLSVRDYFGQLHEFHSDNLDNLIKMAFDECNLLDP